MFLNLERKYINFKFICPTFRLLVRYSSTPNEDKGKSIPDVDSTLNSEHLGWSEQITLQMNTSDQQVIYRNINEGIQYQSKYILKE